MSVGKRSGFEILTAAETKEFNDRYWKKIHESKIKPKLEEWQKGFWEYCEAIASLPKEWAAAQDDGKVRIIRHGDNQFIAACEDFAPMRYVIGKGKWEEVVISESGNTDAELPKWRTVGYFSQRLIVGNGKEGCGDNR